MMTRPTVVAVLLFLCQQLFAADAATQPAVKSSAVPGHGAATQVAAGGAASQPAELRVSPPGKNPAWAIVIPQKDLEIIDDSTDHTGKIRQVTAMSGALIVSVFLEPAPKAGPAATVRGTYWGRALKGPFKKDHIKLADAGDFATVEYIVPDMEGTPINQKNLNLYAVHKGVWIDVHVSKSDFTDKDQAIFDEVTRHLRFDDGNAATQPGAPPGDGAPKSPAGH